jgi:hypothetical protein
MNTTSTSEEGATGDLSSGGTPLVAPLQGSSPRVEPSTEQATAPADTPTVEASPTGGLTVGAGAGSMTTATSTTGLSEGFALTSDPTLRSGLTLYFQGGPPLTASHTTAPTSSNQAVASTRDITAPLIAALRSPVTPTMEQLRETWGLSPMLPLPVLDQQTIASVTEDTLPTGGANTATLLLNPPIAMVRGVRRC